MTTCLALNSLHNLHNSHSRDARLWVRTLALVMTLALLLSVFLGQVHAVKHGGLVGAHTTSVDHNHAHAHDHDHPNDHGFFAKLFSNHSTDNDCRLYDQLGDCHAMPVLAAASLPVVLPSFQVAIFAGQALARWAALFDARGPPLTV